MIELRNVSFQYNGCVQEQTIQNMNLKIQSGEIVLLCGESGCGKTTVTRLINGLIPGFYEGKMEGEVLINDKDVSKDPVHHTAQMVGSVFQNPRTQFFNVDTTGEVIFGCENLGQNITDILSQKERVTQEFHIDSLMDRNIFALSGGEKQKIACASVSAMSQDIIVLDEPSASLDFEAVKELKEIISVWKNQGKTVIIAEHRIYYLMDVLDRVIYMKSGKIEKDVLINEFSKISLNILKKMGLRALNLREVELVKSKQTPSYGITIQDFMFQYSKTSIHALKIEKAEIPSRGIVAVIGHNGAGKSTFARCFCGLQKKCKGNLIVNEQKWNSRERLKRCYMVMQDVNHQLFTESVLEELLVSMKKEVDEKAERILESLDLLELKEMHPLAISGGQKQRVAIASAVASNRDVIIFDEPTSGLDYKHMYEVSKVLQMLESQGKLIILITHDYELICECCTHVIQIEKGELVKNYEISQTGFQKIKDFFEI